MNELVAIMTASAPGEFLAGGCVAHALLLLTCPW
jgi:hypothetical protein